VGTFVPGRGLGSLPDLAYHRLSYSEICDLLETRRLRFDTVIACVGMADAEGRRSLGVIDGYLQLAIDSAARVIVEEVEWLPTIPGAASVGSDNLSIVSTDHRRGDDQPKLAGSFDEVDARIAANVVRCLPALPTLALGIGRIADAISSVLLDRGDVAVLTGAIQQTTRTLHDSGALDSSVLRGMSVVGDDDLLQWASSGPVRLESSSRIHNPAELGSVERFVSVLGAIGIDRRGNVNSEFVGDRLVSGLGGAPDFSLGAFSSVGGLSIVALRSATSRCETKLVQELQRWSIPGQHVDIVVTERGIARLTGSSIASRAERLSAIF
jgi:acyl-CoA hydrolase